MDPRGQYFSQGNTGIATILPQRQERNFLDYASRIPLMKANQRQDRAEQDAKRREEDLKQIKQFDAWRYYQPTIQKKYDDLIEYVRGDYDPLELKSKLQELSTLSKATLQMKDDYEAIRQQYKQNKLVNTGKAQESFIRRFHGDSSEESLRNIMSESVDPEWFLNPNTDEGVDIINKYETIKDVIGSPAFEEEFVRRVQSDPQWRWLARGLQEGTQDEILTKMRSFLTFDDDSEKVRIKNAELLADEGFVDVFMSNPYSRKLIEVEARKIAGSEPVSDIHRAEAIAEVLKPLAAGDVEQRTMTRTARSSVRGEGEVNVPIDDFSRFWGDLREGKAEAYDFGFSGEKDVRGTNVENISRERLPDEVAGPELPYVTMQYERKEGDEIVTDTKYIDPRTIGIQEAKAIYRQRVKKVGPYSQYSDSRFDMRMDSFGTETVDDL